jgi:hypothetical protein
MSAGRGVLARSNQDGEQGKEVNENSIIVDQLCGRHSTAVAIL